MKGNPKRPPWSQPLCQECYIARFKAKCVVTSDWPAKEHCYDCSAVTEGGIYLDVRPEDQKPRRFNRVQRIDNDAEIKEWIRKHGEYRGGVIPGSAENDGNPPLIDSAEKEK